MGVDERLASGADGLLNLVRQKRELIVGDGASLAGSPDPDHDLVPTEGLDDAGALADRQAGGLQSGESAPALLTLTTTTDGGAVLSGPGVDNARAVMTTEGAVHAYNLRTHWTTCQSIGE